MTTVQTTVAWMTLLRNVTTWAAGFVITGATGSACTYKFDLEKRCASLAQRGESLPDECRDVDWQSRAQGGASGASQGNPPVTNGAGGQVSETGGSSGTDNSSVSGNTGTAGTSSVNNDSGGSGSTVTTVQCEFGLRDCDNDSSCETKVLEDPANCGRCAHSCLGGTCQSGVCLARVIASGQANPTALAVDDSGVFWVNKGTVGVADGSLMHAALEADSGGGVPAAIELASKQAEPCGIAVTDSVFWVSLGDGAVQQMGKAGGASMNLGSGVGVLSAAAGSKCRIAANSSWVVWKAADHMIVRALTGSAATTKLTANPNDLAVDENYVYYTLTNTQGLTDPGLYRVPFVGGSPVALYSFGREGTNFVSMTLTSTDVCAQETYDFHYECFTKTAVTGQGAAGSIDVNIKDKSPIAADADYVYWFAQSELRRGSRKNGVVESVTAVVAPSDIVLHRGGIYWTEPANARVMMVAAP